MLSVELIQEMVHDLFLIKKSRITTIELFKELRSMYPLCQQEESSNFMNQLIVSLKSDTSRFTEIKNISPEERKLYDFGETGSSLWELNENYFRSPVDLSSIKVKVENNVKELPINQKWQRTRYKSIDWTILCVKAIKSSPDRKMTQAEISYWISENEPLLSSMDESKRNRRIASTLSERKDLFIKVKWQKTDREPSHKGRKSSWWMLRGEALNREDMGDNKRESIDIFDTSAFEASWSISPATLRNMMLEGLNESEDKMMTTLEMRDYLRKVNIECQNVSKSFLTSKIYTAIKSPEGFAQFLQIQDPTEEEKARHKWGPRGSILYAIKKEQKKQSNNIDTSNKNEYDDDLSGDDPSLEPSVIRELIKEVLEYSPEGKLTTLEIRKQFYKMFPKYRRYDQTKLTPCIRNALTAAEGLSKFKPVEEITESDRQLHEWGTRGATLWTLVDYNKNNNNNNERNNVTYEEPNFNNHNQRDQMMIEKEEKLRKWEEELKKKEEYLKKWEEELNNKMYKMNGS